MNADISVIIPCYNTIDTIERALESVLCQSLSPKEIIMIDDKSTDNTYTYLCELKNKYNFYKNIEIIVLSQEINKGVGSTRNLGWNYSRCKYIAFLDADDTWIKNKLEFQYQFFLNDKDLILCGHKYIIKVDDNSATIEKKIDQFISVSAISQLLVNKFATSTVMLKRDIEFRFKDSKRYSEDFLLWSEIVLNNNKAIVLNEVLAIYYKQIYGDAGLSSNMIKMYKGNLDSYKILYQYHYYSWLYYLIFISFSTLKFFRRVLIVHFRSLKKAK